MTYPFKTAFEDAKKHAREMYPEESCGLIVKGSYIACENMASSVELHVDSPDCSCKRCSFMIDPAIYAGHSARSGIDMVVHSHPDGPYFPSKMDMESQAATAVPWAIVPLDEERSGDPVIWGDQLEIRPVLGREFMHGVTDCYSLIRDCFRLGKEGLDKQGVEGWPFPPITLVDQPRNDAWWAAGEDLYEKNFLRAGFVAIDASEAQPGDVFLLNIRSKVSNHGGVLVGNDMILHHLPQRLSRRDPAGLWGRQATRWIRYIGPVDA